MRTPVRRKQSSVVKRTSLVITMTASTTATAKRHLQSLASMFSTAAASSSPPPKDLYYRILPFGNPRVSVVPVLDQWAREGRPVEHHNFRIIIKQLRKFKRFTHALEVSEWMGINKYFDLLPGDFAVRLDLFSKVHGLKRAETYYSDIPVDSRTVEVYSALMNCYAYAKDVLKAEEVMQKIRKMEGHHEKTLSYNVLLKLYSNMGEHAKVESLVQEMEEKGIAQDKFTCNIRLNSYALASDVEAMEKLLMKMEADPEVSMSYQSYAVAANCYIRAGSVEKASATLKKLEHLARGQRFAYEMLLSYYASMGKKKEVYRIWNLYKKIGRVYNMTYLAMISALAKLDDLDGAQKIYDEWEAQKNMFDYKLPNLLVKAYCHKGLLEKAESFVNQFVESGKEPSGTMWHHLAAGYCKDDHMEKTVETFKKTILASQIGCKPDIAILVSCLEYLKGEGRIEAVKELTGLLKEKCELPTEVLESLV